MKVSYDGDKSPTHCTKGTRSNPGKDAHLKMTKTILFAMKMTIVFAMTMTLVFAMTMDQYLQ